MSRSARSFGDLFFTTHPVEPIVCFIDPTSVANVGMPVAMASIRDSGELSDNEEITLISKELRSF